MIKELPESKDNVLGFEISGKVSMDQEKEWEAKLENALEQYKEINVLVVLQEKASWGVKSGIEDLKWILQHMKRFNKIAIVSDSSVWKWLIAVDSQFAKMVGISEKHFEIAQMDEAWAWIKE